jgi:hypothetical protein
MSNLNISIDFSNEEILLRKIYVNAPAQSRLNIILKRLAESEIGPVKLITIVSGIEALARSLLTNHDAFQGNIDEKYTKYRYKKPEELVEEFLALKGYINYSDYFKNDTWSLFKSAVNFRNLITHECTYLGQDKYPILITSCEIILESLIVLGNLEKEKN